MISRKYYLSFLASLIFSTSMAMEESNKEIHPLQANRFPNAEELIGFAQNLFDLAVKKQSRVVLSQAFPDPLESGLISLKLPDQEAYHYHRFAALAMAHKDLGDQEKQKDPNAAIQYYMKSIGFVESYLKLFETVILRDIDKGAPLSHCTFIYQVGGTTSFELGNSMLLKNQSLPSEQAKFFYVKKFKESASYFERVLSFHFQIPQKDLADIKFRLYNTYASLMYYGFDQEKPSFLEKAQEIHKDFKSGTSQEEVKYFEFTTKSLEFWKKKNEIKNLSNRKGGTPKIQGIREQNKNKLILTLHENLDASKEIMYPYFLQEIASKHEYLETLGEFKNYPEKSETILYIEGKIKELLIQEEHSNSLYDIYERYMKLFSFQKLKENMLNVILPTFIEREDAEGALAHVLVLAQLEKKQSPTLSILTRYTQAIIKNMAGDYEEWIAIEKELQESIERKEQNKQQQKQQQKQRQQEKITQSIKARNNNSKAKPERKIIANQQEKRDNLQQTASTSTQSNDTPSQEQYEPSISASQAKEAKLIRHQEAEKEREAKKDPLKENTTTSTTTVTANTSSQEQDLREPEVLPIRELYDLTKIAKKVEDEIENNTWTFTRENLIDYFEALGCKAEEGGRHKKLPLPKAIIVQHGEEVITVLNDFSGALTLPRWDQSYNNGQVPSYLRIQILKAREKMAILQTKVNNMKKRDII